MRAHILAIAQLQICIIDHELDFYYFLGCLNTKSLMCYVIMCIIGVLVISVCAVHSDHGAFH
jgi:hypothetical protein